MTINQINPNDIQAEVTGVITSTTEAQAKNGNSFVTLVLSDKTGSVTVRMWSTSLSDLSDVSLVGQVVSVSGQINVYNGTLQLIVSQVDFSIREDLERSDYVFGAPDNWLDAKNYVYETIKSLRKTAPDYYEIVKSILFEKPKEMNVHGLTDNVKFETQPAAVSIHHNFEGGLVYHVARMLSQAEKLQPIYPIVNLPLLQTAILLHDAGKMLEYSGVENTETTTDGRLFGHIMIIDGWLNQYLADNDADIHDDKWRLLRHAILAHHGQLDWGSPVFPITPEAQMIHQIDVLDAKMMQYEKAYAQTEPHEMSHDKFYGLNNQRVYHGKI